MICSKCGTTESDRWYIKAQLCKKCYHDNYYHNPRNTERLKKLSTLAFKTKRDKWKAIVIEHYSHGTNKCECCGESIMRFLTIDHINGGGNKHRKEIGLNKIYRWLIENNFPEGFQVLCMNCNWGRGLGICPHKLIK